MATYYLKSPLSQQDVEQLHVGDVVYISGNVFTCRSRLHRWVLDEGHPFPVDTSDRNVLIHVGPIMLKDGERWKLVSFMPTSSIRFEKWGADAVDQWGLRMIIGKTTMGEDTTAMMVKNKCVHVSPQCVSPNLWVDSIEVEKVDLFDELGSIEATWYLKLIELGPFVVDIDCQGNSLYKNHEAEVDERRDEVYKKLGLSDFHYTKLY